MGIIGVIFGLLGLISIGDVEKKCETQCDDEECCIEECKENALSFFEELKEDIGDLLKNNVGLLLIGGACARFVSIHAIKYYSPLYFQHFYPSHITEFSEVNALF
jgi:hypothetical protein